MTVLLLERDLAGGTAFGPLLRPGEEGCLGCIRARREASGRAPGAFRLVPPDALGAEAALLEDNQMRRGEGQDPPLLERFLPLPGCRCPRHLRRSGGVLEELIGPHLGPVRRAFAFTALPGLVTAVAEGAATLGTSGQPVLARGTATACEGGTALRIALAEAVERYCAGFWEESAVRRRASVPRDEACLAGDAATPMVRGARLADGAPAWIPAELAYLPFRPGMPGDAAGLAAGADVAEATARAVAERIERDLVPGFLAGRRPAARLAADAARMTLLLGIAQGHAVCASVARHRAAPPHASIGFGAAPDTAVAAAKAEAERLHVEAHMRGLALAGPMLPRKAGNPLDRFIHGIAFRQEACSEFWQRIEALPRAGGAWEADAPHGAPKVIATIEVTTPDIRPFGLAVIRAVSFPAGMFGPGTK